MTIEKKFKALVRERMKRTGETYTVAKRNLEDSARSSSVANPGPTPAPESKSYEEIRRGFREESLGTWCRLVEELAGNKSIVSWTNQADIVRVLNQIGARSPLNHTMHPDGGGLDLSGAGVSRESGCIALDFDGTTAVIRPIRLDLVRPSNDPLAEWAYFRLETGNLDPSGVYEAANDLHHEELLELRPGKYVERSHFDAGYYGHDENGGEVPLPRGARPVRRYFHGPFLVVSKGSTYNGVTSTYDGRHARMNDVEFRTYIELAVKMVRDAGRYGIDPESGWNERWLSALSD